ncbi:phage integrase Arm DNA-binding domain-containing protein [Grimontia sp. SpTr1]|uniref:phage integrase Arm DNA-binding domain-containing protein n=1 Tax=Grimontia sp. SpTr1 TaxID=2995319 RepID=UPI00248BF6E6|nr:phage integrase Arm DNA-binding domain-containing protein [Grimontia sp. SpTr1]
MAARPRSHNLTIQNLYEKLDKRSGKVYYQYRDARTGRFHGLGTDRKRAIAVAKELNEKISQQLLEHYQYLLDDNKTKVKRRGITLAKWSEKYLAYQKERQQAGELANTTVRQRQYFTHLLTKRLGQVGLKDIDTKAIAELLEEYKAQGKANMASHLRLTCIDIYKEAQHAGEVDPGYNPALATRAPRLRVTRQRLTKEDWPAIEAAASRSKSGYMLNAIHLALTTGLRRQDVCNLRFSDVKKGYLHVTLSKSRGKTKLAFPLELENPLIGLTLGDIISRCRRTGTVSQYLIHYTSRQSGKIGGQVSPLAISKSFSRIRDKSGLCWTAGTPPSFHELRSLAERTYSTLGFDTQKLLGHKRQAMTDKYNDARGREYTYITLPRISKK